jgi:chromosomal replication initiation ATPase DnaA
MSRAYTIPGLKSKNELIAEAFNIDHRKLPTRTRERDVVEARQFAMWYHYFYEGYSQAAAGDLYNRDHATVIHGCKQVETLMQVDKRFQIKAIRAMKMLNAVNEANNAEKNNQKVGVL